eukprot:988603-Alexandrium_andersonii.AAC.1
MEDSDAQCRRVLSNETRLIRALQLVVLAPTGAPGRQPLVPAPEPHALQHLWGRASPAGGLPYQWASDARRHGLGDPHSEATHVPGH